MLEIGKKAPAFTLIDQNENKVSLNDFQGKWLVLYFYPKDNTSGCTVEAKDFTCSKKEFSKAGAEILGVSPDPTKSHQNFILKQDLDITLLSDPEKKVLEKYGVWQLKKMYGKDYHGVVRTTFLIDPNGKVASKWDKVKVKGHADEVLEKLKELQ